MIPDMQTDSIIFTARTHCLPIELLQLSESKSSRVGGSAPLYFNEDNHPRTSTGEAMKYLLTLDLDHTRFNGASVSVFLNPDKAAMWSSRKLADQPAIIAISHPSGIESRTSGRKLLVHPPHTDSLEEAPDEVIPYAKIGGAPGCMQSETALDQARSRSLGFLFQIDDASILMPAFDQFYLNGGCLFVFSAFGCTALDPCAFWEP